MKRRQRVMGAALLGTLLQVTATVAVAAEVVVCRAPSGHVELESALDGDCCPTAARRTDASLRAVDDCAGCVDTPLLHAGPVGAVKDAVAVAPPLPWRMLSATAPTGMLARRSPVCAAPPGPRRTVVLLI